MQRSYTRGVGLEGFNFVNDALTSPGAAAPANRNSYAYEEGFSFVSYFMRTDYRYMERYLVGVSVRTDGSSKFGPDRRYGVFPAISAGWILSEEDFAKFIPKLSFLKLTGSLGKTGNANIGFNEYIGIYSPGANYNGENGIAPERLANPNLSWEDNLSYNFNLDFAFFEDKIGGQISFYNRRSYNMLLNRRIPPSSGYELFRENTASLFNRGLELTLSTKNMIKDKFEWTTDFNIATNRNRVTDLAGLPPDAFDQFGSIGQGGEGRVIVGQPVGVHYVVRYAGVQRDDGTLGLWNVDGTPRLDGNGQQLTTSVKGGEALFFDRNGNLMTFNSSPTGDFFAERQPTATPVPRFQGGITNNFKWGNFDASLFFVFSYGGHIYDDAAKNQIGQFGGFAQREEVLNHWTPENRDTDVPNIVGYIPINSDRFLYDASYIRLRNISIGYTVPEKVLEKYKISRLRFYVSSTNLFLITRYKGLDPEVLQNTQTNSEAGNIAAGGPYLGTPQARTIIAGFNINF